TNSTGPYRGAGRPEGVFVIERLMDEAAHALGLDPADIRRRNLVPAGAFPYRTSTGQVYDSGNYPAAFERALTLAEYDRQRAEQARARARGDVVGVGLAAYVEPWAAGWPPVFSRRRRPTWSRSSAAGRCEAFPGGARRGLRSPISLIAARACRRARRPGSTPPCSSTPRARCGRSARASRPSRSIATPAASRSPAECGSTMPAPSSNRSWPRRSFTAATQREHG